MNILYFHQYFSTPQGAAGNRSYKMARALVLAGHRVTMICGSSKSTVSGLHGPYRSGVRKGIVDGIHIVEFDLPYSNHLSFIKRTKLFIIFALRSISIAMREPCDLVFATSTPLTAGLPGIFCRWFRKKSFVFEVRDLWPELPKEMGVISNPIVLTLMSALEWMCYRSSTACIGLSPGIVEGIRKRSRAELPICMIPNGCDLELFSGESIVPRRPENVHDSDLIAIFAGAHGLANGLQSVLKASEILKKRNRDDIKLIFIGDGKLKPDLQAEVIKKELNNCIFLDPVPKMMLAEYLKGADLGLMILADIPAFYYGTSPNKFFDYISSGLPVLNNYPGWLAEMIKEYNSGYAVSPEDPLAFADALEHAADNRDQLPVMGVNALKLAKKEFDREKLAAQFVAWLENANKVGQ